MKLIFAVPALLWQEPQPVSGLSAEGLGRLWRFGRVVRQERDSVMRLFARYLWTDSLRAAALRRLGLPEDTPAVFASPLWQQMGMHQMNTLEGSGIGIDAAEAEQWCAGLSDFYRGEGWHFYPYRPDLWLLAAPHRQDWQSEPVLDIVGRLDGTVRAWGEGSGEWLRLQTEIQMWLHSHEGNVRRLQQGRPPVNGIWLWQDWQGEALLRCCAADTPWALECPQRVPLPSSWADIERLSAGRQELAVFWDGLLPSRYTGDMWAYREQLAYWDETFFLPAAQALSQGRLKSVVVDCDGLRLEVGRGGCWAFWRRKRMFDGRFGTD